MGRTLVLNASFEPIHIVSWQRAVVLLFQNKVEVLEESEITIRTVTLTMRIPAVLRLLQYVPMAQKKRMIRFSRENVFRRDRCICQYCGNTVSKLHLTLDHVVPIVQGGTKDWENIVTACRTCNQKKGGRTPKQAGMRPIRHPVSPTWLPEVEFGIVDSSAPSPWKNYLNSYAEPPG